MPGLQRRLEITLFAGVLGVGAILPVHAEDPGTLARYRSRIDSMHEFAGEYTWHFVTKPQVLTFDEMNQRIRDVQDRHAKESGLEDSFQGILTRLSEGDYGAYRDFSSTIARIDPESRTVTYDTLYSFHITLNGSSFRRTEERWVNRTDGAMKFLVRTSAFNGTHYVSYYQSFLPGSSQRIHITDDTDDVLEVNGLFRQDPRLGLFPPSERSDSHGEFRFQPEESTSTEHVYTMTMNDPSTGEARAWARLTLDAQYAVPLLYRDGGCGEGYPVALEWSAEYSKTGEFDPWVPTRIVLRTGGPEGLLHGGTLSECVMDQWEDYSASGKEAPTSAFFAPPH